MELVLLPVWNIDAHLGDPQDGVGGAGTIRCSPTTQI